MSILIQSEVKQTDSLDVDRLIDERMILRILQPSLQKQIEDSIKFDPELASSIVCLNENLYLSLESIADEEKRDQVYKVIQNYQIDNEVSLDKVPANLRACLQASKRRQSRFIGAVAVGAVLGVMLGLMGMAIGVLIVSMLGLTEDAAGAVITAVTFIACYTVGWFVATYYLWRIRPLPIWKS